MPWKSRIASPETRRLVLAGLMLLLLAGTTAVAMWLTQARSRPWPSDEPTHRLGAFTLAVPDGFKSQRVSDADGEQRTIFVDAGGQRTLTLALLDESRALSPIAAMRHASHLLVPTAELGEATMHQIGPVTVMQMIGYSVAQARDGAPVRRKHVMAVATVDGRVYLTTELSGIGQIHSDDQRIVLGVMRSVHDGRYRSADMTALRTRGVQLPMLEGLTAIAPAGRFEQDALRAIYVPESHVHFFRLVVGVLTADELWDQIEPLYDGPMLKDEALRSQEAVWRFLAATYAKANGREPADEAFVVATASSHGTLTKLVVRDSQRAADHHERWVMLTQDGQVVIVDIHADRRATDVSHQAAEMLMATLNMEVSRHDN